MLPSDAELILQAQVDTERFSALYNRYVEKIYNYFWYRVGHDTDISEDLTQETFVRAFQALPRFKISDKSYVSYLLTIAHNVLVNFYRTPKTLSLDLEQMDVPEEIWSDIETKDSIRSLWLAIQSLSLAEQDILYLKYRRGLKIREIAEITEKTENAVKLCLSRARKKLALHPHLQTIASFTDRKHTPKTPRFGKL